MSSELFPILPSDPPRRREAGELWRSVEEFESPGQPAEDEFPWRGNLLPENASRRDWMKTFGAGIAALATAACTKQPQEKILPYVKQPEEHVPGVPLFYATSMPFRGHAVGLLVESWEGRPTKVEGNQRHPASLGRTLPWQQSSTYDLYDPDRSQEVLFQGRPSGYDQFLSNLANVKAELGNGAGLHVLSEPVSSPSLIALRDTLKARYPAMQWHEYDPAGMDNAAQGAQLAFGRVVEPVYLMDKADVILSLDCDFLLSLPGSIAYARGFISRRHAEADRTRMNRLYVVEPTPTITGDKADHKLPLRADLIEPLARTIAAQVGVGAGSPGGLTGPVQKWASVVAKDLQAARGRSLVVAGEGQPPAVHALAAAMNQALGNAGQTVVYVDPVVPTAGAQAQSLQALVNELRGGRVRCLLMTGVNPVYDTPAELGFAEAFQKAQLRIHHGLYQDETAVLSHWHVPAAHYLESWGDCRAYDGTISLMQPLIAPLYGGHSAHEVVTAFSPDNPLVAGYSIVKNYYLKQLGSEAAWEAAVHDGFIGNSAFTPVAVTAKTDLAGLAYAPNPGQGTEIVFRPDPSIWDGRFANNVWLQELPKPHTKLTWDNAAHVSPATAKRLGVAPEDMVELEFRGRKVQAPVWVTPGQADDSIAVHLGYGRRMAGRGAQLNYNDGGRELQGYGFDAYQLRRMDALHMGSGLNLRKTGDKWAVACTQLHHSLEGRDIVRWAENAEYVKDNELFRTEQNEEKEANQVTLSLYPEWNYDGYRWAMAIDQNACIGCNACVVACQAENNVPTVGKEQVIRSREMHWLRIDRYYQGTLDNPEVHFQPMLCQHCEKAPCEPVCPVAATVHSGEGLNQMVYNRCVGTRYCSNNCPYKVRRFNFMLWQDWNTPSLEPLRNPDVTVRSRGVMEKCTFCVQRIQAAKIETEKEGRRIQDGDVVTACQTACPTDAIIFGDLNDKGSRVRRLREHPLSYTVLAELATQSRVGYLAKLSNKNPELTRQS